MSIRVEGHRYGVAYRCSLSLKEKLNKALHLIELDHMNPEPFM